MIKEIGESKCVEQMAVAGAEEMGARLLGEVDEGELIDVSFWARNLCAL